MYTHMHISIIFLYIYLYAEILERNNFYTTLINIIACLSEQKIECIYTSLYILFS
jgi:hypothetical protein